MLALTRDYIRLAVDVPNKEEAIRAAGQVLVRNGAIDPAYIDSMFGREHQADTYLSNGIAIPHGMQQDRELIHRTAVSIIQIPAGVEWNKGQTVHLVVGIAAKSDEHIAVLAALTDILDDSAKAARLAHTNNPQEIIDELLRRNSGAPHPSNAITSASAASVEVPVSGKSGLHARPATLLAEIASRFQATINIAYQGKNANGKSMASLLKLGAECGALLRISAEGPDANDALKTLQQAIQDGLEDEESPTTEASSQPTWQPISKGRAISGIAAAPGIAIGRLFQLQSAELVITDHPKDPDSEKKSLHQAIADAVTAINAIYDNMKTRSGKSEAAIFRAHLALLQDPELPTETCTLIDAGHSAAWSWQQAITKRMAELQQLDSQRLAERAADWKDVGQRVLRLLTGAKTNAYQLPDEPVILLAEDLAPSITARLDTKRVLGLCTAEGGPTAHTAIITRSLDLPAMVGAGPTLLALTASGECILDGTAGKLYFEPSTEDLRSAREFQSAWQQRRNTDFTTRFQPALMTDGHRVEVTANISNVAEASAALAAGAEGVGLLRTEFLFLGRDRAPTEDEQYDSYRKMAQALGGLPLIIRTLDIGGDKAVPYLSLPHEENPFLGVRGIRLCLSQPELFLPQLRAIYRTAKEYYVRIMFPMISTMEELRAAKQLAEQVRLEIGAPPVEMGMMVEVPATVLLAQEFAREVDFFSIGTNDLTQYTMAMDRLHASLAKQVDGMHPAVLRLIRMTVDAATAAGKWVGVCGGIAGEELGAAILSGLGVAELSMSLPAVPTIKATLRRLSLAQVQQLAQRALACINADEVRRLSMH